MKFKNGWAVAGSSGLYIGWWQTRIAAIVGHVHILYEGSTEFGGPVSQFVYGRSLTKPQAAAWKVCQKRGDRVVKVMLSYT